MSIRIQASTRFDQDTFERAAHFIDDDRQFLDVDLHSCIFVDTFSLVTLLTIMTLGNEAGWELKLRLPSSTGACTYFARMRFFDLLPDDINMDKEPPSVSEHAITLVPLTKLDINAGEYGIEQLCNFTYPQLPLELAEDFTSALAEIGSNVVQHSQATVGFVAGQRFEKPFQGRQPPRLQLVVGDAGVGIRQSLLEARPEVAEISDLAAIELALQPGVTSKPGVHSGVGLTTVKEYAEAFGGILRIRSGNGTIVLRRGHSRGFEVPGLQGTIVSVELCSPGRAR